MHTADKHVLIIMHYFIHIERVKDGFAFCDAVGFPKKNLYGVKIGKRHFSAENLKNIRKYFKIDANCFFDDDVPIYENGPKIKHIAYILNAEKTEIETLIKPRTNNRKKLE